MANLRIVETKVVDSRTIRVTFTEDLDPLINTSNVTIEANTPGVLDSEALSVSIKSNELTISTRSLTPFAAYFMELKSTAQSFKSLNGTSFILEDGKTNRPLIIGPEEPENPIRETLVNFVRDSIYNLDNATLVRKVLNNISDNISRGLHDIGQAKNDNYISVLIADEEKVRGTGPTDRLNEEGAFEVLRVAKRTTGNTVAGSIAFTSFPTDIVTLLRTDINSEVLTAATSGASTFDSLILTTANTFVTKLKSVVFRFQDGSTFDYDISLLGYRIKEPKYDTDFASTFFTLENNQFKLNTTILEDPTIPVPAAGDTMLISYEYKDFGKFIDGDSVEVTQVLDATREVTPPLLTEFTLQHAPIVTAQNIIATSAGATFLDPNAVPPFSATHPAFTKEIPLRFEALPARVGEYAVDYEVGRVFVFGETTDGNGTGNFPPVSTYKYRNSFSSRLDYTYDPDTNDLAASPLRDLATETATISFDFESVLEPAVDFVSKIHTEELNERIDNRLISSNTIQPLNFPITNAFRVFNETTGEVYGLNRFSDNKIVFNATVPPRIFEAKGERASFTNVSNELLLVDEELTNAISVRVFQVLLSNNKIIANTEDIIGSSFNSSAGFSRTDIFSNEIYYDGQTATVTANIDKLSVGKYQIDYNNGIIYVGVSFAQNLDLGTINYKKPVVAPKNPHVLAVDEIFHQVSPNANIAKRINVSSFADGAITPSTFDISDERFTNADTTMPYIFSAGTITVTDDVKNVRHIFDLPDLTNNDSPTDFGPGSTAVGNVITVNSGVEKQETLTVAAGLIVTIPIISAGVSVGSVASVVRISDSIELLDGYQTVSGNVITLAASSGAIVGDVVTVIYTAVMDGAATPIVDYNRGDYFVDYTYLADEILISYEHGDNVIDFRNSDAIDIGETYFVTYRVGALRDALVKNFGSLVNIPILNTLDTTLAREVYRDAVSGALQTFTKGPTVPAIKQLVASITKIDPELKEALFDTWSLGISFLFQNLIEVNGSVSIVPAKFDGGALITSNPGQTITFPVSSNLRLEEGTIETWVIPEWDGLDNDADITFCNVTRNGTALASSSIFIGASSFNPTIVDGKFTLNRTDTPSPVGLPSSVFTSTGMFIFYDTDVKQWKVLARESLADGYIYTGDILSSGEVYDVKFIPGLNEVNDVLRSGTSKIFFEMNLDGYDALNPDGYNDGYSAIDGYFPGDGYVPGFSFDGFSFMADEEHYIFDFAEDSVTNRFSLFKDGRGYLNFRIHDRGSMRIPGRKNQYKVSADIQDWSAGEKHHVAATWRINTSDRMDEMHLFIDGFEVPNIIRFGGRPIAISTDRFRSVKPELLVGVIPKNTVTSSDLTTTAGSAVVTSAATNFTTEGILAGDTIDIKETGGGVFVILTVNETSLTLTTAVSVSLANANFSVNPFSTVVSSKLSLFKNIAVSILSGAVETEIPGLRATIPGYEISKNVFNQDVLTILGNAQAGDSILVRTLGLNHRRARADVFVWGDTTSILKTQLPPPINLDEIQIIPVLLPLVPIGPANAVLGAGVFTASGLTPTQPSNATEGRRLSVRVTGGNVDFTTAVTVTIFGTTAGPTSEVLSFAEPGSQITVNKFRTITSVTVVSKPLISSKDSTAVEIREAFSITEPDGNSTFPIVRFSYKTQVGSTLTGDGGDVVTDDNGAFFDSDVGNSLVISSPAPVAGTFTILEKISSTSVRLTTAVAAPFTDGSYSLFNISLGRSGFQNGFFVLETAGVVDTPFLLMQGFYEFDYSTYLEVPFAPVSNKLAYVGSDFEGNKQANAVLDEMRILNKMITDVRVGEPVTANLDFVTTDFTSLNPFTSDRCTLSLLHFNSLPLENDSDFYIAANKEFVQAGDSVNTNFNQSLVITDTPFILDNKGLLTTVSEGSIEFWVSPRFDTVNDPNFRFYFDASGSVVETVTSTTSGVVKIAGSIQEVLSIRLQTDVSNTGINFFSGGSVESDFQTIKLGQALPFQQTPVKVNYIPRGAAGNRVSIYKNGSGFIVFNVVANGIDYQVRHPVFWERDSWHRVRATYKFNRQDNLDEIRLFIDGEERNVAMFGAGLLFGQGFIFGQQGSGVTDSILVADINFTDTLNQLFIGSDFLGANTAQARIDNLRLSNVSRNPITIGGQPKDVNFSTNLDIVLPVVPDAFTTFLLDFDRIVTKNTDFALLKDPNFGIHDFTLNIIDSFGIVTGNSKVDQLLNTLINTLKPAQSRVLINLVR